MPPEGAVAVNDQAQAGGKRHEAGPKCCFTTKRGNPAGAMAVFGLAGSRAAALGRHGCVLGLGVSNQLCHAKAKPCPCHAVYTRSGHCGRPCVAGSVDFAFAAVGGWVPGCV